MPALQCGPGGSGNAACEVPDVPSVIATTRQPNAQAKASELIIIFANFVFIIVVSLSVFIVLAFFGFSS
jgi:hypothetical protein